MIKISESQIESFAIQLFEHLGYKSLYGPDIAPDGPNPLRVSLEEVVLKESLRLQIATRKLGKIYFNKYR